LNLKRQRRDQTGVGDGLGSGLAVAALGLLTGFISLPILSLVIWTVNEGAWRAMASPVALDALLLSARTTAITMGIIFIVGTPAAFVLARAQFPGKRLVNSLVDIPAVLPPSAAGIALLLAFGRMGLLGEHLWVLGIQLSFTTAAVVMAELFVAMHFYVRQAEVGFGRIDRDVEAAAMVDGAGRAKVFSKITIPLAFPSLVAGAVTAWARALGEFGGTIIFAGSFPGVTQTMPLAIYGTLESDFDAAVALSVLVLGFSFAVILAARFFTRRAEERAG
jgi:molybdate transport system permease protein